jgi:hypothetical protein
MGNAPHMGVDPDGGWSWVTAGIGFAVGAAVGYAVGGDWQSALIGGIAGGVVGGISFNQRRDFFDVGVRSQNSVLKIEPSGFLASSGSYVQDNSSQIALRFVREVFLNIGRRAGEIDFVLEHYGNADFPFLKYDYSRQYDRNGDGDGGDNFVRRGGWAYGGFQSGTTNVNQYLGSSITAVKDVHDPETNTTFTMVRGFPKSILQVSRVNEGTLFKGGPVGSDNVGGYGFLFTSKSPSNPAYVKVAFKSRAQAKTFRLHYQTAGREMQIAEMHKRYYKVKTRTK